jgi:hypothetical protein
MTETAPRRRYAVRVAVDAFVFGFLLSSALALPSARGWLLLGSLFTAFELGRSLVLERHKP